jgi:preprotein translocase subunit SecA
MTGGTISKFLVRLFGSRNERLVKGYMRFVRQAGIYEETLKALDDEALKAKTPEFKNRLSQGQTPQQILPEASTTAKSPKWRQAKEKLLLRLWPHILCS